MLEEEKEHARQVLREARQIRRTFGSDVTLGGTRPAVALSFVKSYDLLLELAESLLSEQDQYESRLHRSPVIDSSSSVHQ